MGSISHLMTQDFAQQLCNILFEAFGCSVYLINKEGIVVASTDSEQIGTFHQMVKNMLEREIREVVVTPKDTEQSESLQPGTYTLLVYKDLPVGILGISAEPKTVRPLMRIAVRMTELWLQNNELIYDLKRALDALEKLRYKNELILNSAGEGIFGLDQHGFITFCNPAAAGMLGYTIEDLIGKDAHDILHYLKTDGFHYTREQGPIYQALANGINHHITDGVFWRQGGSFFPVEYVSTPIEEQGRIVGAVVTFKDITERKRTEEFIRKTEKLSVVGQLAAGVAHEIRNPLTALKGFVQLLHSETATNHDYFEVMLSEIDRINLIVNEFLFLAKPQVVNFQPKDLRPILKNIISLLDAQAILYNVRIVTDFVQDLPPVNCDENQLKQVFINILKNSMEAMPKGGEIGIEVKLAGPNQVLVRFADQGLGIPEDQLPKLGEPFYTTKEKGTGLGLMVSYKIIEAHQGKIHIASQMSKGTTVDIILPIRKD